jgi:hypothetical protein
MLLLHTIPHIRAASGEIRYQLSDGTLILPGYMLSHLDYARGAPPSARLKLYESYAAAMETSPELEEQLLGRLRQDMPDFPTASIVEILRKINTYPPSETYIMIVNALWGKANSQPDRESISKLASDLRAAWPGGVLTTLDEELRNLTDHPRRG